MYYCYESQLMMGIICISLGTGKEVMSIATWVKEPLRLKVRRPPQIYFILFKCYTTVFMPEAGGSCHLPGRQLRY
jgi:hypothetical protein